jgi:molybdopterin-containing oxidoreductase family iron-sulfur binding subunit
VACPYQARSFYGEKKSYFPQGPTPLEKKGYEKHTIGTVQKCDFCMERLDAGLQPACVSACMVKARYVGDLDDPQSEVSRLITHRFGFQLHPEAGSNPKVYYLPP